MIDSILSTLVKSPRFIVIPLLLLLTMGVFTYNHLKVDLFPALNFPVLNIVTESPNQSSLEVERQVTTPIESVLGGVLGVTRVRSTSATGISMVSAEFRWGTEMIRAKQLVTEALTGIRSQLPPGLEPTIENLSNALSMLQGYGLQGGSDPVQLRDLAVYDLKPRLQRIPGVYKVVVMGGKLAEYSVVPNPALMVKYDITLDELKTALADNNILASPGFVNSYAQELAIHANAQYESVSDVKNVVIAVKSGITVRVRDISTVTTAYQYERGDTSERGKPAVLINIFKQPNFDTASLAKNIEGEIIEFKKTLPKAYLIFNYYDQAQLVIDSINSVKESVWIGALLVVLVLGLFLRDLRTTVIATVSIPISLLSAVLLMSLFSIGLNIMSLGGLAIGTGIIVDDTIVVLENIFRWFSNHASTGEKKLQLLILATQEVVRPVLVSTATNIGIFLPMILIEGFAGQLFSPVSFTVTFALLASLIVSVTLIPVIAYHWIELPKPLSISKNTLKSGESKDSRFPSLYRKILQGAIAHRKLVLMTTALPILMMGFSFKKLPIDFLPSLDEGAILLQTVMPTSTSLQEAKRLGGHLENWLRDISDVQNVTRRTGHAPGAEDTDNINHSDIMVKLKPKGQRVFSIDQLIDHLKEKTAPLSEVQVNYLMPLADKINDALGGVPADIGIDFYGQDLDALHRYSAELVQKLKQIPGITEIRPPTDSPVPSLEVKINKEEAGRLGISQRIIFDALMSYSVGLPVTQIRELQKQIGVVIHYSPRGESFDLESIESLPFRTTSLNNVPFEQFAKLSFGEIPSEIYHENSNRKLTVSTNAAGKNLTDVSNDIKKILDEIQFDRGSGWSFSGKFRTQQAALSNMAMVLSLAILVVSLILWLEFQSVPQVLLILMTIPLAGFGAFLSLFIFKQNLNVSSMIGVVMLVGIVVRNGIILVDYINLEKNTHKDFREAVINAAVKRVRPIVMTATVTALGLLPLAAGWGSGAELQRPLAIAVIGGVFSSTLLTLIILPVSASLMQRSFISEK
jgi:CzcA family heavy metal efflux pump